MKPVHPHLSTLTIDNLVSLICGTNDPEHPLAPYRTLRQIGDFFQHDLGLEWAPLPDVSRAQAARAGLQQCNGTPDMARAIEAMVRPADYGKPACDLRAAVESLNQLLAPEGLRLTVLGGGYRLVATAEIELPLTNTSDALSSDYVRELADKCEAKLSIGDLEGAITNARTLLEAVLLSLQEALLGTRNDFDGDLLKQFKVVAKALRMDDTRPDLDDDIKQVVRGLTAIVHGLAPIRNKMSDSHARERKPVPHQARLVVNAAKTAATFLVESYVAQRERDTRAPENTP